MIIAGMGGGDDPAPPAHDLNHLIEFERLLRAGDRRTLASATTVEPCLDHNLGVKSRQGRETSTQKSIQVAARPELEGGAKRTRERTGRPFCS